MRVLLRLVLGVSVLWTAAAACLMPAAWCEQARVSEPACHQESSPEPRRDCCGGCSLVQKAAFPSVSTAAPVLRPVAWAGIAAVRFVAASRPPVDVASRAPPCPLSPLRRPASGRSPPA